MDHHKRPEESVGMDVVEDNATRSIVPFWKEDLMQRRESRGICCSH